MWAGNPECHRDWLRNAETWPVLSGTAKSASFACGTTCVGKKQQQHILSQQMICQDLDSYVAHIESTSEGLHR